MMNMEKELEICLYKISISMNLKIGNNNNTHSKKRYTDFPMVLVLYIKEMFREYLERRKESFIKEVLSKEQIYYNLIEELKKGCWGCFQSNLGRMILGYN